MTRRSPLALAHAAARSLGAAAAQPPIVKLRRLLYGRRSLRMPLISVTTSSNMGPARHALAQRVVAGMLEVTLPFGNSNPFFRTAVPAATPAPREE